MLESVLVAIAEGSLTPLPVRAYAFKDAANAFKYMAQARHIGKLVLSNDSMARSSAPERIVRDDASYLVTGGFGGLGLEAARWLAAKGAGQLILVGRRPPDSEAVSIIAG